ncbi:PLP-dependent aminotransferase family protein [Planococcus sp. APC 4015]|nr:PLP-dependent aminotransferase family protein [Planococcus sp. APC 4015]
MPTSYSSANSFRLATVGANRLARLLGDWGTGESALHHQLAENLRRLVATGALSSGTKFPSERSLGVALGVSRNTVTKSFDLLRGEGVLTSRQGDGTYVSTTHRSRTVRGDDRLRSFTEGEDLDVVDLRSAALPGLAMVADHFDLLDSSRARELVASHGYLPSGLDELRDSVADYYSALGLPTSRDNILITSGAQQALRLGASSVANPGATVVVEEPSFRGAIESLRSLGARLVSVSSGPEGIDTDELAAVVARERPVLIVLQSTVHNPTGSVLDVYRRNRVATIANRFATPVIDDATLADTIIDGDRRPLPLAAGSDLVMTVGSMSKSFWGGLRVGWLRGRPEAIAELAAVKGGQDLGTSLIAQLLASRLLPQIERARDERLRSLTESRRLVLDAIQELLPTWTSEVPLGGGSLWVRLPEMCATSFAHRAERFGVRVLPGSTFSVHDGLDDHLRISYANSPAHTRRGIELLADCWNSLHDSDVG